MVHGFRDHLVHQLGRHVELHPAFLQPGDGQQILHQTDQPLGVVEDVCEDAAPCGLVQQLVIAEQIAGIAGNGGQRGAQVVRDGTQQVGAELFVLGQDCGQLLLFGVAAVVDGQRAFTQYGKQHAVFKVIQRLSLHMDAHHAIDSAVDADGQVQAFCIAEHAGGSAAPMAVAIDPCGGLCFTGREQLRLLVRCGKEIALRQFAMLFGIDHHIPVQQLHQLAGGDVQDVAVILGLLQQLIGIEQHLGAIGCLGGDLRVILQLGSQRAGDDGGDEHHAEGDGIARAIGVQGEAGLGMEIVEQHHTHHRTDGAAGVALGKQGGQQHTEDIYSDDIRLGEAEGIEAQAHQRCGDEQQQGDQQITGMRDQAFQHIGGRGAIGRTDSAIRDDVDIQIRSDLDQLFRQCGLGPEMLAPGVAPSDDDLRHPGDTGELGNLLGHIFTEDGGGIRAQLFGKADILLQTVAVSLLHFLKGGRLHIQRREAAAKGGGHPGGSLDNLCIGGRSGQAYQRVFLRSGSPVFVCHLHPSFRKLIITYIRYHFHHHQAATPAGS